MTGRHDDAWEALAERCVDRRGFVAGTAALVAAAGLGRVPAALAAPPSGELSLFNWAGYVNPKTYNDFTRATGIKVRKDFYVSMEALRTKLRAGARSYDLAVPTGFMVQILARDKLLMPVDWSKLPNVRANIDPKFRRLPFDPTDRYSVVKDWGTTGFLYRTDRVKERPASWRQFVTLAKTTYSGKVTVLDGIPEVIGSMLVMLGFSYNSDSRRELDRARKELLELKPHLLAITSTGYTQLLDSGKAVMALGWNGDGIAVAARKPAAYVVAKEGGEFWVDSYVIPVSARSPDAAHAWIDYVYRPKVSAQETAFTFYGSPVKRSLLRGALSSKILGNGAIFPPPSVVKNLEANRVSPKGAELRSRIWAEFKAA